MSQSLEINISEDVDEKHRFLLGGYCEELSLEIEFRDEDYEDSKDRKTPGLYVEFSFARKVNGELLSDTNTTMPKIREYLETCTGGELPRGPAPRLLPTG